MYRQIAALCTVLALLTVPSYQQGTQDSTLTSPCPDVFLYDPPGTEPGWWSGVVTLSSDILLHSVWLNVMLDSQALSLGQIWNWIGNATTEDGVDFRIDNEDMKIHPGHPVFARFFIQYNPKNRIPKLRTIRLNGKVICNADTHQNATVGKLDVKNHTNVGQPGSTSWGQKLWTNLDTMPGKTVKNDTAAHNSEHGYSNMPASTETIKCGVVSDDNEVASLSYKGMAYTRGDIPWLVAVYIKNTSLLQLPGEPDKKELNFQYNCVGTLVSDRHVITVASCVRHRRSIKNISAETILVRLGAHNLDDWSDDITITRNIAVLSIHEDYDNRTYRNDITMLTLDRPVQFNDYIRPACLWSGDTDLSRVVGFAGVVASWGLQSEEVNRPHYEPHKVLVPIVSTNYCRASNRVFEILTSNTSLCAGSRNGVGPCSGDSGAGLYLKDGGKWRLRGLVSVSLKVVTADGDSTCNLNEYIVYTDTAQFLPWITNIISEK